MRQSAIAVVIGIVVLLVFTYFGKSQKEKKKSTRQTSWAASSQKDKNGSHTSIPDEVQSSGKTILSLVTTIPGIRIKQSKGTVHDHRHNRKGYGKIITLTGSTASFVEGRKPDMIIREKLPAHRWKEDMGYAADGPDGSSFAFRNNTVLCMFQASWDGGDDSDPTYTPDDRYSLTIQCVSESDLQ